VLRQTIRKRMRAKLKAITIELRQRMHDSLPEVGQWLGAVVGGHTRYYGVPTNSIAIQVFRQLVARSWHRVLCRRSQKGYVPWTRMQRLMNHWLPPARICHPYPSARVSVTT
jgi:RNA-directed DNA polymerase